MAYAGFEEVVLDRPFHQIVVDGRLGHFVVILNGFVIISLQSREVGNFEKQLVGKSGLGSATGSKILM